MKAISRRINRLERRSAQSQDGLFTFEELCRHIWQSDREGAGKMAEDPSDWMFASYVRQFEAEEFSSARPRQ